MPVRSLSSAVLKWPDVAAARAAAERWAREVAARDGDVVAAGYFGSVVEPGGRYGVGSDLDLVLVVAEAPLPFERRAARWDVTGLPVPADLLVYTRAEWEALVARHPRGTPLGAVRWVVDQRAA